MQITRPGDLAELVATRFYVGCGGDDPIHATAFQTELLPFHTPLKAIYGSDIGHWDVWEMADALHEAHEPVDDGILTEEQFREFVFSHPVRLSTEMNPNFFVGTRVEDAARQLMSATA
jgi:hypothetical protein